MRGSVSPTSSRRSSVSSNSGNHGHINTIMPSATPTPVPTPTSQTVRRPSVTSTRKTSFNSSTNRKPSFTTRRPSITFNTLKPQSSDSLSQRRLSSLSNSSGRRPSATLSNIFKRPSKDPGSVSATSSPTLTPTLKPQLASADVSPRLLESNNNNSSNNNNKSTSPIPALKLSQSQKLPLDEVKEGEPSGSTEVTENSKEIATNDEIQKDLSKLKDYTITEKSEKQLLIESEKSSDPVEKISEQITEKVKLPEVPASVSATADSDIKSSEKPPTSKSTSTPTPTPAPAPTLTPPQI
ncbi:unnamed protein product [[Candida] boidinii]|nr:unnamed protein product [[Candida] boidinii]